MAEAKYHIGDDGAPSRCVARSAATCPKAKLGDSFHGDLETAQAEAERRFELSYGAFPARTGPVTVSLDEKGKETVDFLLANCDPRELISQGKAVKASDYEKFYDDLRSLERKARNKEITDMYSEDNPERLPYPENFKELSQVERDDFRRKHRSDNQLGKGRIALLEALYEKTPSWAIEEMIAYHRGETDDWPVYYNKGMDEDGVIAAMPRYSDELLEEGIANIERLKTGKGNFTLKAMEGEMLDKVKQDMAAKGLVLEEAIAISPDPKITAEQINYAFTNGVDPETGKELLYHGTGAENLLGILNGGFDKSKGTFSAGAANGEGYYFSSDPAVAANFSRVKTDRSGYLVLCEVVTGGPERTQDKAMTVDIYGRKGGSFGKNSPMGKNTDTNLGNLAKRVTLTIKDRLNPGKYDPYEETFVKDSRQIRPVALVKVSGEARDKL